MKEETPVLDKKTGGLAYPQTRKAKQKLWEDEKKDK